MCLGKDCKKAGSNDLYKHYSKLKSLPGSKNRIKVIKTKCIDYCKKAPVLVANNEIHFHATENSVKITEE
ncbi:(2Fe-2S) ferredoxin domain-containing protein [Peijinzhouia sedimentorum]